METLKPCPFCGGEAKMIHCTADGQDWHMPVCTKSGCNASDDGADQVTTYEEGVELWNARSLETELLEVLEGLSNAVQGMERAKHPAIAEAFDAAEQAINRAKGEQP